MPSAPEGAPGRRLSVVLASVESERNLARALAALDEACRDHDAEIIVVDASRDDSAVIARDSHVPSLVVDRPPGTITPHLWAEGIRRSSGRWVALTTGHCIVPRNWVRGLVDALERGAGAAGSGLLPADDLDAVDLAVFFLRYHGFIGLTRGPVRAADELPGDNAAYPGDELRTVVREPRTGFFEVEYHRVLRRRGASLMAVPSATARFGRSFPLGTISRHRFDHGRQFGEWRTRAGGESRVAIVAKAPLVPMVLYGRAWGHVKRSPELRRAFLRSSIVFLLLAAAWAGGEAAGAIAGAPSHG